MKIIIVFVGHMVHHFSGRNLISLMRGKVAGGAAIERLR